MACNHFQVAMAKRKMWRISFFTIVWSIWLYRNEMIFEGKLGDLMKVDLIKMRITWWVRFKWSNDNPSIIEIINAPSAVVVTSSKCPSKALLKWECPPKRWFKFNTDCAAKGSSSWANSVGIIIECDSKNEVSWISKPSKAPWRLRQLILQICALRGIVLDWQSQHILCSGNEAANNLAKTGIERLNDHLRVHP
ncbi:Uncharacterized protein TCM_029620 [Theobroma cacao]|uniref:RNase H type-1 domain-containing protein n=1 Tax=Theobroma cacao TaxID=3641 RepID=A0A061GDD8_THECC|nr:Uncharacterized protein TCM_029620 [Theobroma cacao]